MTIFSLQTTDIEKVKVITSPVRTYRSSSLGITGSVQLFPTLSKVLYEPTTINNEKSILKDSYFKINYDSTVTNARDARANSGNSSYRNIKTIIDNYLVKDQNITKPKNANLYIERVVPGDTKDLLFPDTSTYPLKKLEKAHMQKMQIKDNLMQYYMAAYPTCDWAYTNYHSLNFFNAKREDSQLLPINSVLMYPAQGTGTPGSSVISSYSFADDFTFDFYINPRYQEDPADVTGHFKAGTIFHVSSSYALSLLTGSSKDENGLPNGFRLLLQLSHSAGTLPSKLNPNAAKVYPNDLVFYSDDNSLNWNNWHHVIVSWKSTKTGDGKGYFSVDGEIKGNFNIPSASVNATCRPSTGTWPENPGTLCVGNFFESTGIGNNGITKFFCTDVARANGVNSLSTDALTEPSQYTFAHPLKAEVHDLSIRNTYAPISGTLMKKQTGHDPDAKGMLFYVPPFFVENISNWRHLKSGISDSGVPFTPSIFMSAKTEDPFNVCLSYGVGGHYINLENFVKDFKANNWPRLLSLQLQKLSTDNSNSSKKTANDHLYSQVNVAKRNLTILPCDDGKFSPSFTNISKESSYRNKYTDFGGSTNYSYINLSNLVPSDTFVTGNLSYYSQKTFDESYTKFAADVFGPTPEKPLSSISAKLNNFINVADDHANTYAGKGYGMLPGAPLMLLQRLRDTSSNQITIFNISNIFYGRRIQAGSFVLQDENLSGSYGQISVTLKDDGFGNLYRADCLTSPAKFNSVGNIFYDEGIIVIKNPHLYFFGKNNFNMSFRGEKTVHTTKYTLLAPAGMVNSSSNTTFMPEWDSGMRASGGADDASEDFVYISDINIHDENMNVIAKARLAQPILKRSRDKIMFKFAYDW